MSVTVQDYRRTDLQARQNGDLFWLTSNVVDGHAVSSLKDKACVLFSFPVAGQQIIIHEIVVRIIRAFTVGTTLELGYYTLATDGVETAGDAELIDVNRFVEVTDILPQVVGYYYPTTGDYVDAIATGATAEGGNLIVGAATTVPAIVLTPKVATIIIGQAKVSMLVSIVPGS